MLVTCAKVHMRSKPCESELTIIVIVTDNQFLEFAVFAHLAPYVLVKSVEVVLQLTRVHLVLGVVGWVLVHVGHEDGLRVRWLHMFARAAVAVAACTDLVVEGAIDLVLLGTENRGEVVGHDGFLPMQVLGRRSDGYVKDGGMEETHAGKTIEVTE